VDSGCIGWTYFGVVVTRGTHVLRKWTLLHLTREKLAEELGILVFTVSNIVANKNNILKQGESSKPCKSQQFLDNPCKMFSLLRSSCLICWKIS
jgi:hypothetical protein